MTHGGSDAVHASVTAAENNHLLAGQINVRQLRVFCFQFFVDVGDEVGQCFMNAGQVFAAESAFDKFVRAHAEKNGVKLVEQFLKRLVFANSRVQNKFDAHALQYFSACPDHFFFKLE